jgi:hypothetical protein
MSDSACEAHSGHEADVQAAQRTGEANTPTVAPGGQATIATTHCSSTVEADRYQLGDEIATGRHGCGLSDDERRRPQDGAGEEVSGRRSWLLWSASGKTRRLQEARNSVDIRRFDNDIHWAARRTNPRRS